MTTSHPFKPFQPLSLLAGLLLLFSGLASAQTASNEPPVSSGLPALTNVTTELPPISTNTVPSLLPPKKLFVPDGRSVRSAFSGKFVVPGRTLRLPAPEADDDSRLPMDWHRSLTFGMNMTQGNSDTLRCTLGLDAAQEKDLHTTRVRARAAYGENDEQKDTEYATALYRYDRQLNKRFYVLGNIDWFSDTVADIDYRVIGILSPGINLCRNDRTVCKFELGAGCLSEKKGDGNDSFAAGRAAASFEHILNAHVLAWASAEYLPKLVDPTVFYLNSEVGLASMLTRDLNLNITLEDRYDSSPATDKTSNDLAFTASMSLRF